MALALKKTDLQRPTAAGRLHEDRKPSAVAAFVEKLRTDDDYLTSLIFEGRGRKIIEGVLLGYVGAATAFMVGREVVVRIGGY